MKKLSEYFITDTAPPLQAIFGIDKGEGLSVISSFIKHFPNIVSSGKSSRKVFRKITIV